MAIRMLAYLGPAIACMLALAVTGCGKQAPRVLDTAPFHYYGLTLFFPKGTVEARAEESERTSTYARLVPDRPKSGNSVDARYNIDLGRWSTGKNTGYGYRLGFQIYPHNSIKTDIGDNYTMICPPPAGSIPAFNCAVLLRSVPLAAIQFNAVPLLPEAARVMVAHAETYLMRAKLQKAND